MLSAITLPLCRMSVSSLATPNLWSCLRKARYWSAYTVGTVFTNTDNMRWPQRNKTEHCTCTRRQMNTAGYFLSFSWSSSVEIIPAMWPTSSWSLRLLRALQTAMAVHRWDHKAFLRINIHAHDKMLYEYNIIHFSVFKHQTKHFSGEYKLHFKIKSWFRCEWVCQVWNLLKDHFNIIKK